MAKQGILIVISGFSGAGKGTLVKELRKRYDNYALSVSATTRKPRTGEVNGREYFFKTKEEFLSMIQTDDLIEYADYVEHYYGTPKSYVKEQMRQGNDVILEIEIQGALKIKEKFPKALLLFVTPPSIKELQYRLTGRGTEDMEAIQCRLRRAKEEAKGIEQYDYLIVNDDLDACVARIHTIIQSEHYRASQNELMIEQLRKELEEIGKEI